MGVHGPPVKNPCTRELYVTELLNLILTSNVLDDFCIEIFHASTCSVVNDKDNVIMIGDVPRQFRMKLPQKEFVALVAVGVR